MEQNLFFRFSNILHKKRQTNKNKPIENYVLIYHMYIYVYNIYFLFLF
jgi:hypothetical protein